MIISYGNIKNITISEAINKRGFKNTWFVNKDRIDICKDCEFRYICSDCSAYLNNLNEKPFKCGYNPYKCVWN